MNNWTPWAVGAGICCVWPALWAIIAFLIGRGYRVRVEKQ